LAWNKLSSLKNKAGDRGNLEPEDKAAGPNGAEFDEEEEVEFTIMLN
jgi:hypothetical protein